MNVDEVIKELEPLAQASYKKVLMQHGVEEPIYGVKIEHMKKIQKRVKKDYKLALDLFDTGVYDWQYLAGLIADEEAMTKKDLTKWVKKAAHAGISEYTVAWVAAESRFGRELALEWIDSKKEGIASSGWATLASLVSVKDDAELDVAELEKLLGRVVKTIHSQPNRVRYVMNSFVIAVGGYVKALTALARKTAAKIGPVSVDMGGTACKVPDAAEYITKMEKRGVLGKKRKTARC